MSVRQPSGASARFVLFPGHPAGLQTLFFTEMWERFSYYGMRALLVLFMVDAVQNGGLGLSDEIATAIYGLYTSAVYLLALPGGWIADRLVGAQRAIWFGGIVIMLGHFTLAIPSPYAFFLGLLLVASGTGLLKPNISAVVGELYPPADPRRDAGFTIFYMGINLGAVVGILTCGWLGESDRFGWHYGFAAAGVGMLLGLVQFRLTRDWLAGAGGHPAEARPEEVIATRRNWRRLWIGLSMALLIVTLMFSGVWRPDPVGLAKAASAVIALLAVAYFAWLLFFSGMSSDERRRVMVIVVLFLAAILFWAGFEQAGSSLNLFAFRHTERSLGGMEIPASWFQFANPMLIIVLAPLFVMLWLALARRRREPSTPAKFGIGLILLGTGFGVMAVAATLVAGGETVAPAWLLSTYLLHTMGELALSPVGLSATTKLSPRRYVSQMMGVWFLAASLGSLLAGLLAGRLVGQELAETPSLYAMVMLGCAGAGVLLLLTAKPICRFIGREF